MQGRLAIFLTVAVVVVLLVALNAASYVRVETEADLEFRPDRSTHNAGATGTRALHDFLRQSGFRVARWAQAPSALRGAKTAERPETFVVVGQLRRPFVAEEARALVRWVWEGGRLVVIDRAPDAALLPASGNWGVSSETFDLPEMHTRPDEPEAMTAGVRPVGPTQPTLLTRDVDQVMPSRFASRLHVYPTSHSGIGPAAATREANDVKDGADESDGARVEDEEDSPPSPPPVLLPPSVGPVAGVETTDEPPPPAEEDSTPRAPVRHFPDARPGEGALLVDYAYGRGRVVVLADPYVVSNGGISRADNLQLAVNVVAGSRDGLIAFDEFHQGAGGGRGGGAFAFFAGTPVLWMFAQAGAVALALLWSRGRRFARALPAPHVDRRSKLEFVASMAELQQRARAHGLAVENVYARTRRALARYAGLAPDAPHEEIAARVAARSGGDGRQLAALLAECEAAVAGRQHTPARKALALVRHLRDLERDLGIRMRAREIRQREKVKR